MRKAKFYWKNPNAPKPNRPNHLGINALIKYNDTLLLEKRSDSSQWGLIGGGLKIDETLKQGLKREIQEETGIIVCEKNMEFCKVYDDPSRIACYPDGNVLRIVSVVFIIHLKEMPKLNCSEESIDLKFFMKDEIIKLNIVESHKEILYDYIKNMY